MFVSSTANWIDYYTAELQAAGARTTIFILVANIDADPLCLPYPQFMLELNDDDLRARALNKWFGAMSKLSSRVLHADEDGDEEDTDLVPKQKKEKAQWTLEDYYCAVCPTEQLYVSTEALERISEAVTNREQDVGKPELAAFTAVFQPSNQAPPPGFDVFAQLLTREGVGCGSFSALFGTFIREADPGWSAAVMRKIVHAASPHRVFAALFSVRGAPWIQSRTVWGDAVDLMVLSVGQVAPVFDGSDFMTAVHGSSVVGRLALRAAGIETASAACTEALPINMDFEALARCLVCSRSHAGPGPHEGSGVKSNQFPDPPDATMSSAGCAVFV